MHRTIVFCLAVAAACGGGSSPSTQVFGSTLNGANETPAPVTTTATGDATFTRTGASVTYVINYTGLSGPPTASHVHVGAAGVNAGTVVVPFTLPAGLGTSGTYGGTISSADVKAGTNGATVISAGNVDDVLAAFASGNAYANIHTTKNPNGEIRGQVTPK